MFALCLPAACESESGGNDAEETGESGDGDCVGSIAYADAWVKEIDAASLGDTMTITIGGTPVSDNFTNRGDVEVRYDGAPGTVSVELRRFMIGTDEQAAKDEWSKLQSWAYSGSIVAPSDDIAPDNCATGFRDGCAIRVWYDGQTQPLLLGADIRVTLPPDWPGFLEIVTEDATVQDDVPLRGSVRIDDLYGSAEIELDSGVVEVKLADDILEGPTCGSALVDACQNYVDPDTQQPAPWDVGCGCTDFGQVRVESRAERAADVTVDVPGTLWATANMDNAQPGLSLDSTPLCTAEVDCAGIGSCEDLIYDASYPWKHQAELNDPGDFAPAGAGYGLVLRSEGCQIVDEVDVADCQGTSEARGFLKVCSGCL